jgi:hypothetical protein
MGIPIEKDKTRKFDQGYTMGQDGTPVNLFWLLKVKVRDAGTRSKSGMDTDLRSQGYCAMARLFPHKTSKFHFWKGLCSLPKSALTFTQRFIVPSVRSTRRGGAAGATKVGKKALPPRSCGPKRPGGVFTLSKWVEQNGLWKFLRLKCSWARDSPVVELSP